MNVIAGPTVIEPAAAVEGIRPDTTSPPLSGRLLIGAHGGDGVSALAALDEAARHERIIKAENNRVALAEARPRARRRRRLSWAEIMGAVRLLRRMARHQEGGTK